jgi:succinoglycan biosynthesis transport protein ExoP
VSSDSGFVPAESVTIRDQLAVMVRRWRVIVLVAILGVVASGFYIHTKSIEYVSHAEVQVKQVTSNQFEGNQTPIANSVAMPTEQRIATSAPVANAAAAVIGHGLTGQQALGHLNVSVPATTQILDFGYRAATPAAAQIGAKAFAAAYLADRKASNVKAIGTLRHELNTQFNQFTNDKVKINQQLSHTSDANLKDSLEGQLSSLDTAIGSTTAQLTELSTIDPSGASLTQPATLPTNPSGASHRLVLAAGLLAGLLLGLIAAYVVDAADDHLHGPQDLAALTGAPVLSRVPLLRSYLPWRRYDLAAEGTSQPKVAEAYRVLANRLVVFAANDSISSILVASPAQGDGRSSVAANLAATFVDLGFRVWLVSADLVPPQVHRLFSPEDAKGMVSVVPLGGSLPDGVRATSQLTVGLEPTERAPGHLTLMTSVEHQRSAGRLLNPLVLARQVRDHQQLVDITIIDAPALLEFADAIPLLPVVDGVVVVADAGATRRSELIELTELLDGTNARVIGSVLNRDGSRVVSHRARQARRRLAEGRWEMKSRRVDLGTDASEARSAEPTSPATPVDSNGHESVIRVGRRPSGGGSNAAGAPGVGWPTERRAPEPPETRPTKRRTTSTDDPVKPPRN